MKKIAILAMLLATTACDKVDTSEEGMNKTFADANSAARDLAGKAEGMLGKLLGDMKPDEDLAKKAMAETGETAIGESDAEAAASDGAEPATSEAPAEAAAEAVIEQKVADQRKAVTVLIPVGKYDWVRSWSSRKNTLEIKADGGWSEPSGGSGFMRNVDNNACFEENNSLFCFSVEKGQNGTLSFTGTGTSSDMTFTLTPKS